MILKFKLFLILFLNTNALELFLKWPMLLKVFTGRLAREILNDEPERNIVFSPVPLQVYMTLFYFPASEELRQEMRFVLAIKKNVTDENLLEFIYRLIYQLPSIASDEMELLTNTVIMGQELSQTFQKIASTGFQTYFERTDKIDVRSINRFVSTSTRNNIKKLLSEQDLKEHSYAVLTNAMYFNGKWKQPFDESLTKDGIFYQFGLDAIKVPMMYTEGYFAYAEFPRINVKIIKLPYENSGVTMTIIMPIEKNGLQEVDQKLLNIALTRKLMKISKVALTMPKFNIVFNIKLKEILGRLGLRSAFTKYANFTDIFEDELESHFKEINQKAYFDVSEGGTGGASGSIIDVGRRQKRSVPIELTIDHPFLFTVGSVKYMYYFGHLTNIPLF